MADPDRRSRLDRSRLDVFSKRIEKKCKNALCHYVSVNGFSQDVRDDSGGTLFITMEATIEAQTPRPDRHPRR